MSFEPVCVRMIWSMAVTVSVGGVLRCFYLLDEDMQKYKWSIWWILGSVSAIMCGLFLCPEEWRMSTGLAGFFCMNLYLAVSTTMDMVFKQVTDMVQYLGLLGGGILILQMSPQPEVCKELIAFIIIQYCFFRKMYGRADVIGFVLCALFLAATGKGIGAYVGHMCLAFGMLAIVQAFRRNIAPNGNLKHPVALFPYIMCGFLLII